MKANSITVKLVGGPDYGEREYTREPPQLNFVVENFHFDKATNRTYAWSERYTGGDELLLKYRGVIPPELCPIRRQLVGEG